MSRRLKSMIAAVTGLTMALASLLFDCLLGLAGAVLIAGSAAVELVVLVPLARGRRSTARVLAKPKPTTTRQLPF